MDNKNTGVYCILNLENNKQYIGSSTNVYTRKNQHFNKLRKNEHFNPHLQYAWNKYGEARFIYIVLERNLSKQEVFKKERDYILSRKT